MERSPLDYETARTRRQPAPQRSDAVNVEQGSRSSVLRVEVWRWMIAEVHSYDDPVESGEFRHWVLSVPLCPRPLRLASQSSPGIVRLHRVPTRRPRQLPHEE